MTCWLVSRHPGAMAWLQRRFPAGRLVPHLDMDRLRTGDVVAGTLPLQLAADVQARGARYLHLLLPLEAGDRGRELDEAAMDRLGAQLAEFRIERLPDPTDPADQRSTLNS